MLKAFKPTSDPTEPWTIGWGHTGKDVTEGMTITQAQADRLLTTDLDKFCKAVAGMLKVPVTENQFSALVSLCYNIGAGNLGTSTLIKLINAGDLVGAAAQFDRWNRDGGKVCAGLVRRRQAEKKLFLS